MIDPIRPAVLAVKGRPGDNLENVTRANVEKGVERLKGLDPILSKLAKTGELKVVGATYELRTGDGPRVRLIGIRHEFACVAVTTRLTFGYWSLIITFRDCIQDSVRRLDTSLLSRFGISAVHQD